MNCQDHGSHRRPTADKTSQSCSSQALWPNTRAGIVAEEVKNVWTSQSKSRGGLGALWASQEESFPLFLKPKEGGHPLYPGSAGERVTPAAEAFSSLLIRELLPSDSAKSLELKTRKGSHTNPKEAWAETTLEATAPVETPRRGRAKVTSQGENPQSSQGQPPKDVWKDIIVRYGIVSPRKGLQMVSHCSKLPSDLEGHILEGKKIPLKSRSPVQELLSLSSVEESQEEEIQPPKEKSKAKRAKERETQCWFLREKKLLQRKLWELGPMPMEGANRLDKKKPQASEPLPKDHYLKSGPRAQRGKVQTLAQNDKNKADERKQSKMDKRKLRVQWWDPTVWGAPVTLVKREQRPRKTCSKSHDDPRKLGFPMGRMSY